MPDWPTIAFDPHIPISWIIALAAMIFISAVLAGVGRLRSMIFRILAGISLCLALLNPQTVEEDREPLKDEVLVIRDISDSMQLGQRQSYSDRIYSELLAELEADPNLEITEVDVGTDVNGTRMTNQLMDSLGNLRKTAWQVLSR